LKRDGRADIELEPIDLATSTLAIVWQSRKTQTCPSGLPGGCSIQRLQSELMVGEEGRHTRVVYRRRRQIVLNKQSAVISETVHSAISRGALLPEPPRGFGWCIPEKLGHFFPINKTFSEAETQLEQ
jgi:hypothetical protein